MSKNNKNKPVKVAPMAPVIETPAVDNQEKQQPAKTVKAKKPVKKVKRPNIFVKIGKKLKEIFSELKKVTWPTFPTVLKQTGVVMVVVAFFLVLIFGFDSILAVFYQMLLKQ